MDQQVNEDTVLSAIRRGEDSLPKLRAATGLEYAQLHVVLHTLEYEWKSIDSTETAGGFQRFTPRSSEKSNGGSKGTLAPITPQAFNKTKASVSARDATLLQRDAPYCTKCRALCLFDGLDTEGRPRWRCKACNLTFEGSSEQVEMAHVDSRKEARAPRHEELGPEEEAVVEDMHHRNARVTLGVKEEAALALMRGGELPEDEARLAEEIDQEIVKAVGVEAVESTDTPEKLCGCGRSATHYGRCAFRRAQYGTQVKQIRQTKHIPRKTFDLPQVEQMMAQAETIADGATALGITIAKLNRRRRWDTDLDEAVKRGRALRNGGSTSEPQIKRFGPFCEANCSPELGHHRDCAFWKEEEARRIAKEAQTLPEEPQKLEQNITGTITNNGTSCGTEIEQPERAQQVKSDISEDTEVAKERGIIPELFSQDTQMVTQQPDLAVGFEVQGKYQIKYEGLTIYCDVPEEVIELAVRLQDRFVEPSRPVPTTIKRAWSLEFEDNSEEGTPALTMMYLVSMLHEGMEEHEKQAVFTLLLYLKRVQAAAAEAREAKKGGQA